MASILRSSKFVRYIAGFARNIIVNTPREFDGNLVNSTHCYCGALSRSLATQASIQHDQNLERRLRSLDQEVRRAGRISRRDIEDVLEEIRTSRSATSSQSLLVIRCCGNLVPEELPETRTKLVQEIWNTLNKLNIPMDISHYNALLRVYLENEHPFSPTEFLSELEAKGIEPNRVTYQRLIARYCQEGDIEGATQILEFMREKQLPVNENVFNALIVGHSQCGDMDSAQGIISVMSQAGLEPSADTYTTLLCGYGKKGDIEAITKTLEECESKEVYLLDKDYLDIVYSLATSGHTEHVPFILSKVRKSVGYNQDAVNLILRLVNKGYEDAAFLVLKSMPRLMNQDGTPRPTGIFFIKQLVKANRPVSKVIEYCNKFESEELNPKALLLAAQTSLELGNSELAFPLLRELQSRGVEIRQHFFWPLIVSKADDSSGMGIVDVLLEMNKFSIVPSSETIRDYVLPNLKGKSSEIMAKLRQANISVGAAACSLVHSLLQKGDIEEAAVIVSQVKAQYFPELLKKPLTNAFYKTSNLDAYIMILHHIYDYVQKRDTVDVDETKLESGADVVGNILLELTNSPRQFNEVIESVLTELVNKGLSLSCTSAERIQDKLGEKMTDEIATLLSKLTSGELSPAPISKKLPSYVPSSQMNIPQLERLIENLQAKQQDVAGLKRQLLTLYCRAKDVEKVEKLLKELGDGFTYSSGVIAQLIEVYATNNKLEETLHYLEKLKEMEPGLTLDGSKTIRVVQLFIDNDRFKEAIDFLETVSLNRRNEKSFAYSALVWRLLNSLADKGQAEELQTLFNVLEQRNFIDVNNVILGPLVKVHIVNDDLQKALKVFQWCCEKYKSTPWKNELACKLIQKEDAENLQKLTDLSTSVHGEINSLYDLVFAFVECGRIRQARKILETPGLQTRPRKINTACERYRQEGMVKQLEDLKDATKDLNHIDRSDIYYQLLLSYIKQEDIDKALGLWTQMQEEDLTPTDEFLHTLGNFLKERSVKVPFITPELKPTSNTQESDISKVKSTAQVFKQCLKQGDVEQALNIKRKTNEVFATNDLSTLIEKLLQQNRVSEATKLTFEMIDRGVFPISKVFRFLLNKLANAGNVEVLDSIGSRLSAEQKKMFSFDNRMCHANVVAGNAENYLVKLENIIDSAKDNELNAVAEQFPRGGVNGILEKYPNLIEKFELVALKYAKRGILSPLNVLWANYFISGDDVKAEEIWSKYIQGAPRIMFQRVLQYARDRQDEALTKKLISHLKSSSVTEGAIGNAYSCLLDILVVKGKDEEAIVNFENAIKDISINYLNRTAVQRVSEIYAKQGKAFTHKIPSKADKIGSTSSSTSDEEKAK